MTSISKDLSEELFEDDSSIAPFLKNDFDPVAFASKVAAHTDHHANLPTQQHPSHLPTLNDLTAVKSTTDAWCNGVSAALDQLAASVANLERRLHSQITARHDDLLAQASGVEKLEVILDSIQSRIHSLSSALERVQTRITEPYNKVSTRTKQLQRLQEACDYVRRIIRLLYLSKRLRVQVENIEKHDSNNYRALGKMKRPVLNSPPDLSKAAQGLSDLAHVEMNVDLSGIDVIAADRIYVQEARTKVKAYAEKFLESAILNTNPSNIAIGLQVFYFLGELNVSIKNSINKVVSNHKREVKLLMELSSLEATHRKNRAKSNKQGGDHSILPGRSSAKPTGVQLRKIMWQNFDVLINEKSMGCVRQVITLQKVLLRKRDPVTHSLYIESCEVQNFSQVVWKDFVGHICEALTILGNKSPDARQYINEDYPSKLFKPLTELWEKSSATRDSLLAFNHTSMKPQKSKFESKFDRFEEIHDLDEDEMMLKNRNYNGMEDVKIAFKNFENNYLARSLSRMFDEVESIWGLEEYGRSRWNVSDPDLDRLVGVMCEELAVSAVDSKLAIAISKNIVKAIKKIKIEAENSLATGSDARQLIAPPTKDQTNNWCIVNTIWKLYQKCDDEFTKLGDGRQDYRTVVVLQALADHSKDWLPKVLESLEDMLELVNTAITPLLYEINQSIKSIIITMHDEGDGVLAESGSDVCLWSRELKEFVSRVVRDHFTTDEIKFSKHTCTLVCKREIMDRLQGLGKRAVELACLNVVLVRNSNTSTNTSELRKRLVKGLGELEHALAPLVNKQGGVYAVEFCGTLVKQTKPLLLSSPETIKKDLISVDSDISGERWHTLMLAVWQRSGFDLWQYSPVGNIGYIAKISRTTNSHSSEIIEEYHKWMYKTKRNSNEYILLHKYGLEQYEKNCEGEGFDDVYEVLLAGVQTFAEKIKMDGK